jgi:hypothetical protein
MLHTPSALALASPAPVDLSSFGDMRRIATRPPEHRDADFDKKFDADTLFYDCFRLPDGRVALLGPPALNLLAQVEGMEIRALPGRQACRFTFRELDRHGRMIVEAPAEAHALELTFAGVAIEVPVGRNEVQDFAGRRVLLTISRNNALHWIRDWLIFARDVHGADAVVLYDNASTHYSAGDVLEEIGKVDGIAAARVVAWPFKFGPQGPDSKRFWDSDFCQHGAWEHARWCYLAKARSVQSADIDEFLLTRTGRSVFDAVEADWIGGFRYRGRWMVGTSRTAIAPDDPARSHFDYDTVLKPQMDRKFGLMPFDRLACPPKWIVVPQKCPPNAQWGIHSIHGWLPSRRMNNAFSYRHFREISDSWKYNRNDRKAFDPTAHEKDAALAAHVARLRT